jgi:hypothetical protein
MEPRRCAHCLSAVDTTAEPRSCPVCGLDPDLPAIDFDDAPAFFLSLNAGGTTHAASAAPEPFPAA